MIDYLVKPDSAKIFRDLHQDLQHNLQAFKRLQGSAKDKDADDHFYNVVMPNSRIEAINKLTGANHPLWRTYTIKEDGVEEWYGCDETEKWAYVGLRFAQNIDDWFGKDAARGGPRVSRPKPIRLKVQKIVRPQILVTIRPELTYIYFKDYCSNKSGGKGDGEQKKFSMKMILQDPKAKKLWDECTLVPLKLFLPTLGPRLLKADQIIKATQKSMHYNETDVDKQEEEEKREQIIEKFRKITEKYRRTHR